MTDAFAGMCERLGLGRPEPEYRFDKDRKFRLDYAWVEERLGLEIEGGIWRRSGKGAHTGGAAVLRDIEKQNLLMLSGWRLLRVTTDMMMNGEVFNLLSKALNHTTR